MLDASLPQIALFANLFFPFSRSLCTKTRQLVDMRWPEEPLYDRYGCLYDGSLVLSSIQSFANLGGVITQMCGLLTTSGERLNTISLMTFFPEQRVWNHCDQDPDSLYHFTHS